MSERVKLIIEQYGNTIIDMYKKGYSNKTIGKEMGISGARVGKLIKDMGIEKHIIARPTKIRVEIVDGVECKTCTGCGVLKPMSEYSKRLNKKNFRCKDCISIYYKKYASNQTMLSKTDYVSEKICSICHQMKSIDDYNWKRLGIKRFSWCKTCGKIRDNQYYKVNKDRFALWHKQYQQNNADRIKEYTKKYYDSKREYKLVISGLKSASDIMESHVPIISPELIDVNIVGYKICGICKQYKCLNDYSKGKYICKKCESIKGKQYRAANPELMKLNSIKRRDYGIEYKKKQRDDMLSLVYTYLLDHPCTTCGMPDIRCLSFHHIDSNNKIDGISNMVSLHYKWEEILDEIGKCVVLCDNCHIKTHYPLGFPQNYIGAKLRKFEYRSNYLLANPCIDCGEDDVQVLHFHHVSGVKDVNVNRLMSSGSMERLVAEIEKCIVLCANCHRIRHSENTRVAKFLSSKLI